MVATSASYPAAGAPRPTAPTSVVQLGDSVAAGEGTLYGFTFNTQTGYWDGPKDPHPTWLGPYQQCHESRFAYGQVLTGQFRRARLTQLACTGSTFAKGVAGPWSEDVPAQFGNPAQPSTLNPRYRAARPNLVLVTLGANDVGFLSIAKACILAGLASKKACTAAEPDGPGNVIKNDLTDQLPTLQRNLQTLAGWIEARGKSMGVVPRIVFTTYPNPLPQNPPAGGTNLCPDARVFSNDQLTYLSTLLVLLDTRIVDAITTYARQHKGAKVAVVNLVHTFDGHRWCTRRGGRYVTPYAYGFGIYHSLADLLAQNPAAFHPTPAGQRAIAAAVRPAVLRLFGAR